MLWKYFNLYLLAIVQDECVKLREDPLRRTRKAFGGAINDFKRKIRFYKSDFVDALNWNSISTIFFIYFTCVAAAVTFGGLLGNHD